MEGKSLIKKKKKKQSFIFHGRGRGGGIEDKKSLQIGNNEGVAEP